MAATKPVVTVLDYGAGNVRSLLNAVNKVGWEVQLVTSASDIENADILVFPGVGAFGSAMKYLKEKEYLAPLKAYIAADKPFFGICIGMQCLFRASEETPGVQGLGIIPGTVARFPSGELSVPHMGWSGVRWPAGRTGLAGTPLAGSDLTVDSKVYFVHSYRVPASSANADWTCMLTDYASPFLAAVSKGNVVATQFHPEKSGPVGLNILSSFLAHATAVVQGSPLPPPGPAASSPNVPATALARRVVACLDVRSNDAGDLVVTKGDQYDVREKEGERGVRNLGKPVELSARYYGEGADEIAFLNITAFRGMPLGDQPMLKVLEDASQRVFVPLTIGGGIRGYVDEGGKAWSALDIASRYFRAGADKVSIGSDAVYAAEEYYATGRSLSGASAIEQIAHVYGSQAVVISVDPRRVYVPSPAAAAGKTVLALPPTQSGPNGEGFVWYQCTVKGGREGRDLDAVALAQAVEALGAGELLVNCVDSDGQKQGFDTLLMAAVCDAVTIPVIASSGAGSPQHFVDIFGATRVEAALAAGIFHRREVGIDQVKEALVAAGVPARVAPVPQETAPPKEAPKEAAPAPASAPASTSYVNATTVGAVAAVVVVGAVAAWYFTRKPSEAPAGKCPHARGAQS